MAHALLVLPLTYAAMQSERLATDKAFAWDPRAGITFAVACGYFLWDIVHSTTHFAGAGFVAHAIACFSVYILGFTPFLAYYGVRCLMFEASTPFLNIHWYLLKTGRGGGKLAMINGVFLLTSFFLARIIYGTYVSYGFFSTLYEVRERVPPAYVYVYGISNVVLNALNWIWFSKMVSTMVARIVKGSAPDAKKDE
ncbi:hypothetical protein AURDEDRAFT_114429 [Auricularia subglabra TFB-10046 SS5]|nr:hypothetical protein AURDEDRAFT_114429 [Auricularia subglabra TFB-10046 SS5]